MAQDDAYLFATMAACFSPSRERWEEMTSERVWPDFVENVRDLLRGSRLPGQESSPASRAGRALSLQEYLADDEVSALFAPPSFEEADDFAARRFAGGVPGAVVPVESLYVTWTSNPERGAFAGRTGLYLSDAALYMRDLIESLGLSVAVVPVESLYVTWTSNPERGAFAGRTGLYLSDAALYMRDLIESLGLSVPVSFSATPDHLTLELEMMSFLLDAGMVQEAHEFLIERFAWLTTYRLKLVEAGREAVFFLAIVDALLGVRACVSEWYEGLKS